MGFAHALLRCVLPTDLDKEPACRLRLTIGLGKHDGRWAAAREHHSFASQ